MTIPVSTVPAVISYLYTAINTQCQADAAVVAGTDEILVKTGEPSRNLPPNVVIISSDVQRSVTWFALVGSGGQNALYEKYTVGVTVTCWTAAGDTADDSSAALALIERVWQIVSYVETAVRTDPSLGGLDLIANPESSTATEVEWTTDPVGLRTEVTVPIHVEASL